MNSCPEPISPGSLATLLTTILGEFGVKVPATGAPVLEYVSCLASNQCLMDSFHLFEWEKSVQVYLAAVVSEADAAKVTEKFMVDAEKRVVKKNIVLDIPDGEGEILCNVEFKLAYGGKILLNTTHFHVRRGRIYGLLGHNGCGKSTLMRAISSGALAGFPGAEELMKLRACFVDHDIDGSDATTPTIDFCLQEPILAPLGREKIRQKLL